jgi:hypothetical protein
MGTPPQDTTLQIWLVGIAEGMCNTVSSLVDSSVFASLLSAPKLWDQLVNKMIARTDESAMNFAPQVTSVLGLGC